MVKNIKYLFLLCMTMCGWLGAQSMQYENLVIENIDVVVENLPDGATFDKQAVLARIKTRTGDIFSHIDFDNDLKTLAKEFDRVIPRLEAINNKMYITLRIWPKPTIRLIKWSGNNQVSISKLEKELEITPGSVFDRQGFNKAFHKLKAYYVKKGFFEAELDYFVNLDPCTNEVDVEIRIQEGRAGKIKDIIFCGFTPHEEEEILDVIHTKKYNLFLSWYTNEGLFHEDAIQQDQFTILNYIQNKGFADAKIDVDVCEADECNRIIVYITLDRGECYTFGSITVEGNKLFCEDEIAGLYEFCEGEPYSPDLIRETIRNITNYYGRRGYIDAVVDFEPTLDCECLRYNLHIAIEEGDQYRVGLIKVFGNCSTQTKVILHEILLTPGEIFNIEKLQKTEERLQNIGYFKHVNVYAVKSEGPCSLGANYRDVNIEVEETSTGYFSASGGFSNSESLFFGLNLSEKNFNHQGLGCFWREGLCALRGGGEYFHMNATFGTKSTKYELGWTKPYFMDTQWTVGFNLENTRTRYISSHYDIHATALTLHASYQYNPFLRTGWHYRIRDSRIRITDEKDYDEFMEDREDELKEDKEGRKLTHEQRKQKAQSDWMVYDHDMNKLRKQAKHQGIVSGIGTTLTYDSPNHPSCPTEGFRSRLTAEVVGVGGYHSWFGIGYLNTYYYPLHRHGVLKFRADIRFLVPYGDTFGDMIPIDERLFLGGDTTVRGYRSYRLGPQFDKDEPEGGNSMQFMSLEYNHKLFKRAEGFVFFDSGALTENVLGFGRLNMSVGFGTRLKVLDSIPPVTLGLGFPLNPRSNSDVKRFFFQMGGQF